jgi:uncharacterized protein (DUF58 family)
MIRKPVIWFLCLLLALALLLQLPLLALLCTLLLLAAGLAWLWNRYVLARVQYKITLSGDRAFIGDELELAIRIENRKPLPLVALTVRVLMPAGMTVLVDKVDRDFHGRQVLSRRVSMSWYEGLTWRYRVRCEARGAYQIGMATLEAGDPFGFFQTIRDEPGAARLLIYPERLPLLAHALPARQPVGNLRSQQLIHDPLRIVGAREYTPDDPLKDIHWAATARTATLQTRVYETTSERTLAIFLDLDTFERYWEGIDPEQIERMISAAATIALQSLEAGMAVGLYVNGAPAEQAHAARIAPSRSPAQLEQIMQSLAALTPYSLLPIARLLQIEAASLPWSASVLLISAIAPEATRGAMLALRRRRRQAAWLWMDDSAPPELPGVAMYHAPAHTDWQRRKSAG